MARVEMDYYMKKPLKIRANYNETLFKSIITSEFPPLQIASDDKEIQQLKTDKARLMHEVGFMLVTCRCF